MDQKTNRLYPAAPKAKDDLDKRLEKKLNGVNSFDNSVDNMKK